MQRWKKGFIIMVAFIILSIFAGLAIIFMVLGYHTKNIATTEYLYNQANFTAESAIEYAFARLISDFAKGDLQKANAPWVFFGEDENKNGTLDRGEDKNKDSILNTQSCDITICNTYSYQEYINSNNISIRPTKVLLTSQDFSLIFKLKIVDENAKISINGPEKPTIQMINTLGKLLFGEEELGKKLLTNRPEDGFTSIENIIPIVGYEKYEKLKEYLTVLSFRYKNVLKGQGISNRIGEIEKQDNIFLFFNQLFPKRWEFEARSPININVAQKEIIIAQLTGVNGYYIDIPTDAEIRKYRNYFFSELQKMPVKQDFVNKLIDFYNKNDMSFPGGVFPAGIMRLSNPVSLAQAEQIAEKIVKRRLQKEFNNFGGKFGLDEFLNSLNDILSKEQIDILKVNLNPNAMLTFLNPDKILKRVTDKLSLTDYTTETSFLPGGYFTIESLGIVQKGKKSLAVVHTRKLVKLWSSIYFDTIADFVSANPAQSYMESSKIVYTRRNSIYPYYDSVKTIPKEAISVGSLGLALNIYPVSPFGTLTIPDIPEGRIGLNTLNNLFKEEKEKINIFHHQLSSPPDTVNDDSLMCKVRPLFSFATDGIYTESCSIYSIRGNEYANIVHQYESEMKKLLDNPEEGSASIVAGSRKSSKSSDKKKAEAFEIPRMDIIKLLRTMQDKDIKTTGYTQQRKKNKRPYTREEVIASEIKKVFVRAGITYSPSLLWEVYFKPLFEKGTASIVFTTKITEELVKNVLSKSTVDYIMEQVCKGCSGSSCSGSCAYLNKVLTKMKEFYCTISDYVRRSYEDIPVLPDITKAQKFEKIDINSLQQKAAKKEEEELFKKCWKMSPEKWYNFFNSLEFKGNESGFTLGAASIVTPGSLKEEVLSCFKNVRQVLFFFDICGEWNSATRETLWIFPHSLCFWDIIGGPNECDLHFWIPSFSEELVEKVFKEEDKKFIGILKKIARKSVFCQGISAIGYWFKPNWIFKDDNIVKGYTFINYPLLNTYILPAQHKGKDINMLLYLISGMGNENIGDFTLENSFGIKKTIPLEIFENNQWQRISIVKAHEYAKEDVAENQSDIMAKFMRALRGEIPSKISLFFLHNNKVFVSAENVGKKLVSVPAWGGINAFFGSDSSFGFYLGSLTTSHKSTEETIFNEKYPDPSLYGFVGVDGTVDEVVVYPPDYGLDKVQKVEGQILQEGRYNKVGGDFTLPTLCFPPHTKLLAVHSNTYFTPQTKDFVALVTISGSWQVKVADNENNTAPLGKMVSIEGFVKVQLNLYPPREFVTSINPLYETPYIEDLTLYINQIPLIFKSASIRK